MFPSNTCIPLAQKFVLSFLISLFSLPLFSENLFSESVSNKKKSCSRYRVFFRAPKNQKNIGLRTACAVKQKELFFSVLMPEGVELARSTLFETAGKGEAWRTYNLGKKKPEATKLGDFTFDFNGSRYEYQLLYIPVKNPEPIKIVPPKEQRLFIGGSFASFSITQPGFDAKQSKPGIFFRVLHFPLLGSLGLGTLLDLPISTSQSEQSISFLQVELFTSYEWIISTGFRLRPKIGYGNFNFSHDDTNIGMGGSSILAGLGFSFDLGNSLWGFLDGSSLGLVGSGLKSQYTLDLGLVFRASSLLGYGLSLRLQGFSGVDAEEQERSLSQMGFQGFITF